MKVIKSRTIDVTPKHTSAKTQYWDMEPDDEAYVYTWLYRLLADMSELSTFDEDLKKEWFKRRPGSYPKGKQGPNSHASMLGGICSAKLKDPKKNLSDPQLDCVEDLFDIIADYYANEEDAPKSVTFHKKLFSLE